MTDPYGREYAPPKPKRPKHVWPIRLARLLCLPLFVVLGVGGILLVVPMFPFGVLWAGDDFDVDEFAGFLLSPAVGLYKVFEREIQARIEFNEELEGKECDTS